MKLQMKERLLRQRFVPRAAWNGSSGAGAWRSETTAAGGGVENESWSVERRRKRRKGKGQRGI